MSDQPVCDLTYEEVLEIIQELERIETVYETAKIVTYRPLPRADKQDFHADGGKYDIRLVLGSNRSGKTVAGVCEAIAHSLGYRPWLHPEHPDYIVRLCDGNPIPVPNIGRVIAQDFEQAIRQTIWPKFEEWAPKHMIKEVIRSPRKVPQVLKWSNGSIIYFMSNDQDDMAFEGPNGHWVWADEPIDYKKYVGLKRGLIDFSGEMWMTMTPLTQAWIADIVMGRANEPDSGAKTYKFSVWDNCTENGGYLSKAAILSFLSDLREDELEARLHGNFLHLAGRVYKEWTPEPPFWIDPFDIPRTWPRVCLADPHTRKPIAVMWVAISPDDQIFIYRALYDQTLRTVEMVADCMKQMEGWVEGPNGWADAYIGEDTERMTNRIIDWSANEAERVTGQTIKREFARCGFPFQDALKRNAAAGYDAIHQALRPGKYQWDEPTLITFNTCSPVKQNFENFCFDEWGSNKQRDLMGQKDGIRKVHDDFIDMIRYYFQSGLNYHVLRQFMRQHQQETQDEFHIGRLKLPELERVRRNQETINGRRSQADHRGIYRPRS